MCYAVGMPVSWILAYKFACDADCDEVVHVDFQGGNATLAAARREARLRGWLITRSGDAYCPAHRRLR